MAASRGDDCRGAGTSDRVFPPKDKGRLPISAATLASLRSGLRKVTTYPKGAGYSAPRGSKIISARKTGTEEVLKEGAPHAWFAGCAPADQPRTTMMVIVEHGGEGSKAAAPIFRQIVENTLSPEQMTKALQKLLQPFRCLQTMD